MPLLATYEGSPRCIVEDAMMLGRRNYALAGAPLRLYSDLPEAPARMDTMVDVLRTQPIPSPAELLKTLPSGDSWLQMSHRSQGRLGVFFLLAEDPQRRLEARPSSSLLHQMSLIEHVLSQPHLLSVMIADEVGLGKTIEAGTIVKRLVESQPGLRVLYLSPARLVRNVAKEFLEKIGLESEVYASKDNTAAIERHKLICASMQKAVFPTNFDKVTKSPPFDVIIVDECHRLSDFDVDGGSGSKGIQLVRELIKRQREKGPNGRVILMSGTPHQGNPVRFANLLDLLLREGEKKESLAGRVIYRTKDKIVDWEGRLLFPRRDVRETTIVSLGGAYRAWYNGVGDLYDHSASKGASSRATGWAKGQALQWAASSLNAGLAFLVRLAIRRLNWNLDRAEMKGAVGALRPYRGGDLNQDIGQLYNQLYKQVVENSDAGDEQPEDEEDAEPPWKPDAKLLAKLLDDGVALLDSEVAVEKWGFVKKIIQEAGDEKVVLFAQPVETVSAVVRFLHREFGQVPAQILGGQSDEDRGRQIDLFWLKEGPRFLVSSRAGGEGLNLQCARRLIHLDVPWNPMELEQRVGRVHRFGSRKPIIVDTIVVEGTREEDAYRIAREKLHIIVRQMKGDVSREEFEMLFSRVMSVVPPEQLAMVVQNASSGNVDSTTENAIGNLVQEGYDRWSGFAQKYKGEQDKIKLLDPGAATWDDFKNVLIRHGNATETETVLKDIILPEEVLGDASKTEALPAVNFNHTTFACGDLAGLPVPTKDGKNILQAGTNVPQITALLRKLAFPDQPTGAAFLRAGQELRELGLPCGILAFVRQSIGNQSGTFIEQGLKFHLYVVNENGVRTEFGDADNAGRVKKANVIRAIQSAPKIQTPTQSPMADVLIRQELEIWNLLRSISDDDRERNVFHAAWPVFAAILNA